ARFADAGDHVENDRFIWLESDAVLDRDDWIKYRPFRTREPRPVTQGQWVGQVVAATDEPCAIGLVRSTTAFDAMHHEQMKHPRRLLRARPRPPCADDRPPRPHDFGLHEQIAEYAMQLVGDCRRENDFRITGNVDRPARARTIDDTHTP